MRCYVWEGYCWYVRGRADGYQRGNGEVRGEEALD